MDASVETSAVVTVAAFLVALVAAVVGYWYVGRGGKPGGAATAGAPAAATAAPAPNATVPGTAPASAAGSTGASSSSAAASAAAAAAAAATASPAASSAAGSASSAFAAGAGPGVGVITGVTPAVASTDSRQLFVTNPQITQVASALLAKEALVLAKDEEDLWKAFRVYAADFLNEYIKATEAFLFPNHAQLYKPQGRISNEVYDSPTHKEIACRLFNLCRGLQEGSFAGRNGLATAVFVGTQGIGKSWMLRLFVSVCNALFPNLWAMYSTLDDIVDHPLSSTPLLETVKSRLFGHNIPDPDLFTALAKSNRRLLLILDELDTLYKQDPDQHVGPSPSRNVYLDTLHNLNQFGNNSDGRVAVVLCGSTLLLHQLIKAETSLSERYCMVKKAPHLNNTKFRPVRIHGAAPTCMALARQVAPHSETDKEVRKALFKFGAVPRDLDTYFSDRTFLRKIPPIPQDLRKWWKLIIDRMRNDNHNMLKAIESDSNLIMTSAWEKEFKPLSRKMIDDEIWPEGMAKVDADFGDKEKQGDIIDRLLDEKLFSEDKEGLLYPFAMEDLLSRHHDKETSTLKGKAWEATKALGPAVLKAGAKAGLKAAVGVP